jgi:hypothetical protein
MTGEMSERAAKEQAKERDGWECRFCGVTNEQHTEEYGRGLHAHHVVKQDDGGADRPRNLITVCRSCHQTLERTQADALSRIMDAEYNIGEERHEEVVEQRDALIERVIELERAIRDPEFYTRLLGPVTAYGEVVSVKFGTRTQVTSTSEDARDSYEEWGDSLRRVSLKADIKKIAEGRVSRTADTEHSQVVEREVRK